MLFSAKWKLKPAVSFLHDPLGIYEFFWFVWFQKRSGIPSYITNVLYSETKCLDYLVFAVFLQLILNADNFYLIEF